MKPTEPLMTSGVKYHDLAGLLRGWIVSVAVVMLSIVSVAADRGQAQTVRRVDPTTLDGKLIFGFQGW
jgi:hypothetical protein